MLLAVAIMFVASALAGYGTGYRYGRKKSNQIGTLLLPNPNDERWERFVGRSCRDRECSIATHDGFRLVGPRGTINVSLGCENPVDVDGVGLRGAAAERYRKKVITEWIERVSRTAIEAAP